MTYTMTGDAHKKQRKLLNPVFSPKYMRDMVPIFYEVVGLVSSNSVPHLDASFTSPVAPTSHRTARKGRPRRARHGGMDGAHRAGARRPSRSRILFRPARQRPGGRIRRCPQVLFVRSLLSLISLSSSLCSSHLLARQVMHETAMLRRLLRYVPTIRAFDLGHKFLQHFPH